MKTARRIVLAAVIGAGLCGAGCAAGGPARRESPTTRPSQVAVLAANSLVRTDLPYVERAADKQTLDIYAPKGVAGAPVVVYIHGGEWFQGDKSEVSYKPRFLNEHGIVFVSVNYRLSGTDQHPAQVNDIAAAIAWLQRHAADYGGDPRKIVLMGHSAGCHLVTLIGLDPRPLATVGLKPADLLGVVSWSGGAFDLVQRAQGQGLYPRAIRDNFGPNENVWRDASPVAHVGDFKPLPPFLFVSAGDGNPGSRTASDDLSAKITAAGGRARSLVLPGKTHFTSDQELGAPGDATGNVLLDFIRDAQHGR